MLSLLLLLLLVSFQPSSSANSCQDMPEFTRNVKDFGARVERYNCSDNCSSVHVTDKRCKCFDLNVTQEECASTGYFIKALQSLDTSFTSHISVRHMIKALNRTIPKCLSGSKNFCSPPVKVSAKSLHKKLEDLVQPINSVQ